MDRTDENNADAMKKFCIYCFKEMTSRETRAHVFPEVIGGRMWLEHVCASCNSKLGNSIEREVKDCLFLAYGIEKLRLGKWEKAFSQLPFTDPERGNVLERKGGELVAKLSFKPDGSRVGSREAVMKNMLQTIAKTRPNWKEDFMSQFDSGARIITIAGDRYRREDITVCDTIQVQTKCRFPLGVVAKVVYEAAYGCGFPNGEVIHAVRASTFDVYVKNGNSTRIVVRPEFAKRVSIINRDVLDGTITDYESLDYQPSHRTDFRVTPRGIAYVKVNFFEKVSFLVVLGDVSYSGVVNEWLMSGRVVWPTDSHEVYLEEFPAGYGEQLSRDHALADIGWYRFCDDWS